MQRNLTFTLLIASVLLLAACGTVAPSAAPESAPVEGQEAAPLQEAAPEVPPAEEQPPADEEQAPPEEKCYDTDPHPIGLSIAQDYEVSYEQVMTWFCEGHSFDDILLALELSTVTETSAEDMLAMRAEEMTWDEIYEAIGFIQ